MSLAVRSPALRPAFVVRCIRFWSRHPVLLNVALFALVWLLYGSLSIRGYASEYWARSNDIWLQGDTSRFDHAPGIDNVLLPALTAAVGTVSRKAGFPFGTRAFIVCSAIPYALFIYGVGRYVRRREVGSRVLAMAATVALYTTGMIPYMTSWGGYVDGLGYLLMLPVFIWPESLAIYVVTFVLQCLNHYLGALSLLMFAFVWHSLRAMERSEVDRGAAWKSWAAAFIPRAVLSAGIMAAFMTFWSTTHPVAAGVRQALVVEKWRDPAGMLQEAIGAFPFTLLSALKLAIVPVAALALARVPHRRLRALVIAIPFVAALALNFVFVDITRVTTLVVMPVLLVTILAAGRASTLEPVQRRGLRRLMAVTALLGLLVPNYYVNNGEIRVPPSTVLGKAIVWLTGG
jgi:hypothetical protein